MPDLAEFQLLCGRLEHHEVSPAEFIEQCTRAMAEAIDCSRAGIWLFEKEGDDRVLRCLGIYDRGANRMTRVPDEVRHLVGAYFEALEQTGHVVAVDALTHPSTAGLFSQHANVNDVRSLLAAAFSVNGRLFGAFTCSNTREPMNWTRAQLATLKRMGARASLALARPTHASAFTLPVPHPAQRVSDGSEAS
jgi:GAF domain-containing protein